MYHVKLHEFKIDQPKAEWDRCHLIYTFNNVGIKFLVVIKL